jgi:NADP-reducing hydrogenase subunit HndB
MATKITSPEELNRLRDEFKKDLELRSGAKEITVTVHMGTCGIGAGARDVLMELADGLASASRSDVTIKQSGCLGLCEFEPMITLRDQGGKEYCYGGLDRSKVRRIVRQHIQGGDPVQEYLVKT